VVGISDERAQQVRQLGQHLGVLDDLAGHPIGEKQLDVDRRPAQRVPNVVLRAEPQQVVKEAAVLVVVVPRAVRRGQERLRDLVELLVRPVVRLGQSSSLGQEPHQPGDQRPAERPCVGLHRWVHDRLDVEG
jgi:hypothetical protein